MENLRDLSDDEIDALLLLLFNDAAQNHSGPGIAVRKKSIPELTDADLLRIRSRNHPDKWPNVNLDAYQEAVQELGRRRSKRPRNQTI